ncbi:MAG: DNA polymerase III psi subunit [Cognaticolwellia sp.]|jgi:DNA polymerase III psi subunit
MSINKRQFDLLQAMGITVWQRRALSGQNSLSADSSETVQITEQASDSINAVTPQSSSTPDQDTTQQTLHNKNIAVDLKTLLKHQLFKDIISSIGTSSADLSITHNQIDLGIINWQFTANKNIEFKHNCLKTPDLTTLANSPELKKSLWQSIGSLSSS